MKKSLAIAVGTVALLASGMPLAQDAKAPGSMPNATAMQPGSPMNMGSQMSQMDEHLKKMQALHEKMLSTTTPEERQKVMDAQRQEMQGGMAMMNPMMQGGGMGSGMIGQKGKPAGANTQIQIMQKRMDMMQMMMQTMMDQQGMMARPKSLDAEPKK